MPLTSSSIAVLIIGAGPVGLMAACELKRHGIACRIIDKKAMPTQTSNALALHARSLEIWNNIGLIESALALGQKLSGIHFYTEKLSSLLKLNFNEVIDSPYPYALSLPQSQTEQLLNKKLNGSGINVERDKKLINLSQQGNTVTATLINTAGKEEVVTTSWLLGCDGYRSTVRDLLDIDYQGHDLKHHFIMIDAPLQWPLPYDEVSLFPHRQGPVAVFPMKTSSRIIIETTHTKNTKEGSLLTREHFIEQLKHRWSFSFKLDKALWMSQFTIHERLAARYCQRQVFLLGDAAHVHSPAGGQGMNTGMQDAYNLAWKLALVIKGYAKTQLLDSYEIERRPIAKAVLSSSDKLTKMATLKQPILIKLRDWLLKHIGSLPSIQKKIASQITGVGIAYLESPLSKDYHQVGSLKAGMRFATMMQGSQFNLLIEDSHPELANIESLINKNYSHIIKLIKLNKQDPLVKHYQLQQRFCLVRPDQYIASFAKHCCELDSYLKTRIQLVL